jgi:hypothetical protein
MTAAENKAVFLSYASPAFARALRRGKQDADAARFALTLNTERSTLNFEVTKPVINRGGSDLER